MYSKENENITWGYAKTKYDALERIRPSLKKISRERYDKEGNLIQSKAKGKKK